MTCSKKLAIMLFATVFIGVCFSAILLISGSWAGALAQLLITAGVAIIQSNLLSKNCRGRELTQQEVHLHTCTEIVRRFGPLLDITVPQASGVKTTRKGLALLAGLKVFHRGGSAEEATGKFVFVNENYPGGGTYEILSINVVKYTTRNHRHSVRFNY